jgi:hypothetical protein
MNPIAKAIQDVKYTIPKAILEKVFIDGSRYWRPTIANSLEAQIENVVIRPRVMVDCNLVGGLEALIPLNGLAFETPYEYTTVVYVPKTRTQGRRINSVRNVTFFNAMAVGGLYGGIAGLTGNVAGINAIDNSAAVSVAASVMSSYDKIPQTSTSNVRLIAENTILINAGVMVPTNSFLRCVLENDENLSNLPLRSYRFFSKLVEFAVKAYIYNEMIITMDRGELFFGQELGRFKEIIDSYADANENYQTFLREKMQQTFLMSDEASYSRFIKMMVGGQR